MLIYILLNGSTSFSTLLWPPGLWALYREDIYCSFLTNSLYTPRGSSASRHKAEAQPPKYDQTPTNISHNSRKLKTTQDQTSSSLNAS